MQISAGMTQKRAVKALFSLWSLKKRKTRHKHIHTGALKKLTKKDFKVKKLLDNI